MPTFSTRISNLRPNTADSNNQNSQSTWFSYVRCTYSREYGGQSIPPTMSEFMRELNQLSGRFEFVANGDTLEEAKISLSNNIFPRVPSRPRYLSDNAWSDRIKVHAWVRMIIAFNCYAKLRELYNVTPSHNVDFIGSAGNNHSRRNRWEPRFHGRCVLHLSDDTIARIILLVTENASLSTTLFWREIFYLYESNQYIRRLQNPRYAVTGQPQQESRPQAVPIPPIAPSTSSIRSSSIGTVDDPNTVIAQEYLNREEEANFDIIPDNQQIAAMIARTENLLPRDFRKILYEMCIAAQISHEVETHEEILPQAENGEGTVSPVNTFEAIVDLLSAFRAF